MFIRIFAPNKIPIMRLFLTIISLFLATLLSAAEPSTRTHYPLNDSWRFSIMSEGRFEPEVVSLPHSWSLDGIEQATAYYQRQIRIPDEFRGKRLFLRFGGVSNIATLFVNGSYVTEHAGPYTAFTVEITDKVRYGETNSIRVVVSNNHHSGMLPISTDYDLYGGIYRDVELIVTNRNIISPTFYSSDGVFVVQKDVKESRVSGTVKVHVSTLDAGNHPVMVRFVGVDGYEVKSYTTKTEKSAKDHLLELPFSIDYPELWSPEHPYLYTVEVYLGDIAKPSDVVRFKTGFRSVTIGDDNRLCINGKSVDVCGVNLAHDRKGCGMALTESHLLGDLSDICEMGATALRSVIGPHLPSLYNECDKEGMMVWIDSPFARNSVLFADICYYPTTQYRNNGFEQLREVIYQNYNHPSVVMWGVFNFVSQMGDDVVGYVKELNDIAHEIDPSRPTVGCSNSDGDINFVTDLIVLRQNVGWLRGSYEDIRVWCRQLKDNKRFSELRYGVCYGEQGAIDHVADIVRRMEYDSWFRPERTNTIMHESYSSLLSEAAIFWGTWIDNMYDYASMYRPQGICYSGIVDFDHQRRKDIFYLYRALWNKSEPTYYIAERSWSNRCEEQQTIKVYCSSEPLLTVDDQSVALSAVSPVVWEAHSVRIDDESVVRLYDTAGVCRDSVTLRVDKMRVPR